MAQPPVVFADAVISVSLANGVVRIVLGSVDAENKMQPTGTLVMPFNQFGGALNNLVNAYQRLGMLSRMVDVLRFRSRLDTATEGDRLQLAGALAASGRYDQAADEFELLVDLDPDNAAGHASVAQRLRAHRN